MQPLKTLPRFAHLIGVIKVVDSNPNGDPETRRPRLDMDYGFITPMAQNRLIREAANFLGHQTLCNSTDNLDELPVIRDAMAKKADAATLLIHLRDYFDFVNFGLAPTGHAGKILRGYHPGGVWTASEARSLLPVQVKDRKITRSFITGETHPGGRNQSFGSYSVVDVGYYRMFYSLSPYFARERGYTAGDLNTFVSVVREMFEFSRRGQARAGMWFQNLWLVTSNRRMLFLDDVNIDIERDGVAGTPATHDEQISFSLFRPEGTEVKRVI
jgi:Cas7 group CRISPR-associated protein Csh2